jgi:IMP dehydrogenase/GMP reductase
MQENNKKFDFDDILIIPKEHTNIESRFREINPYVNGLFVHKLPLFTAPMDSVLVYDNYHEFQENKIRVVLPRTVDNIILGGTDPLFHSYSLHEFENHYIKNKGKRYPMHVLIDVANGHMEKIITLAKQAKEIRPELIIMAGNIANPETYRWYAESNVIDYVRIGIGNGNGCLTTQQTGVGYPKASLIRESYLIKEELLHTGIENPTKIVADGGMKDYSDIIKALGLGADYVMVGSLFNKALESSGQNYLYNIKISPTFAEHCFELGLPVKKQFYGMSTKLAQKKMGKTEFKTSEGVVRYRKVEYKLYDWIENFEHYLRSAMSYSNARTLDEFIGKIDYRFITENAFNRFNK